MKRTGRTLLGAALLATLGGGEAFATNGARPISSGPRAGGRAGADTAVADDGTALNTNPAGLGFIEGSRVDLTLAAVSPQIRWRNPEDKEWSRIENGAFGQLTGPGHGLVLAGPLPALAYEIRPDLHLGLGVFALNGNLIDMNARSPFFNERAKPWELSIREIGIGAGLGWRPLPWLAIGIAPAAIFGQIENDQPVSQSKDILQGHPAGESGPTYADTAPFLGVSDIRGFGDMDGVDVAGFRMRAGILAIPFEWEGGSLSVGLSYATPTFKRNLKLGRAATVTVDFREQIDRLDPDGTLLKPIIEANTGIPADQQRYIGKYNLDLEPLDFPQEVAFGAALQLERAMISADVTWINWSATYEAFHAKLSDGESPELNELTGDSSGETAVNVPLDWRDQIVYAAGVAFAPVEGVVLRAGYNYARNPVPRRTLQPTTPAIIEHHVTAGATFLVREDIEVTLAWEHAFRKTERIGRSDGNTEVENSVISAEIDFLVVGIGVRF